MVVWCDVEHNESDDDNELEGPYSSDSEESIGSYDSIARNADFINFY